MVTELHFSNHKQRQSPILRSEITTAQKAMKARKMKKPDTGEMKLPTPPPPLSRNSLNPQAMTAEEKARILAETEKAMTEETIRSARLQLVQDASDEFKRIQKEAKTANTEANEHNEAMAGRRRLMLIISAVAIGVGIVLKAVELTVMGGW